MQRTRQAVITGIGVISPLATGRGPLWQAIEGGEGCVRPLQIFDNGTLPIHIGAEVLDFAPQKLIKQRKSIKLMCREVAMGVAVAELAVSDASLDTANIDSSRFGVIYGSEMLYGPTEELHDLFRASMVEQKFNIHRFGDSIATQLFPLWLLKYLPNMAACHVGIAHQACGPNNTVVQGDASGLLALIEAVTAIERGWADVMIVGGCGNRLNPAMNVYVSHDRTTGEHPEPDRASRPFDAQRTGQVLGEGAAALIVETREHAIARGATILGEVAGFGRAFEARQADGEYTGQQLERVLRQALQTAELSANHIDHVNADGISNLIDDRREAQAIHRVFDDVPVTALKSYFGNLGASVGLVELAISLIGMQVGSIAPTRNYQYPDPECPVNVIHEQFKPVTQPAFVSVNQSSTGQCAAVAIKT
jgi:3-oxoacyl-[acyl-carrier-protein] synthase II